MPGFEFMGEEERRAIEALFKRNGGVLFRYHPQAFAVAELEEKIRAFIGTRFAHAVSSGTAAIKTAMVAAGIRPGDEVISTCFTFIAPIEAILEIGAVPVLAEIDQSYSMDPADVEQKITPRTKAIVAVPMWASCDMGALQRIAERHGLLLIEDSAQCFGGTYEGRRTGTFGLVGSFSFDAGKTMTTGEGGVVVTDDEEMYRVAAEYADHGHMHDTTVPRGQDPRRAPGFNFRMGELQGAIGCVQIERVESIIKQQRANYALVAAKLADLPDIELRQFADEQGQIASWLCFRVADSGFAARIVKRLSEAEVPVSTLPESHEWHFAGYWKHLFQRLEGYDLVNLAGHWPRSDNLLHRSVGVFVKAKMTEDEARRMGANISGAVTAG